MVEALAMIVLALPQHAEESRQAFAVLQQGLRRAVRVHAAVVAAGAFVAQVRPLIELSVDDHRAAGAHFQIYADRVAECMVEP